MSYKNSYIQMTHITSGSVAYNPSTDCTNITLKRCAAPNTETAASAYTSQGKRKATDVDPIRSKEDIKRVAEYFMTTGQKAYRLRNYMMFVLGISIAIRPSDLLSLRVRDVLNSDSTVKRELLTCESKTRKMNRPFLNHVVQEAIKNYIDSEYSHGTINMNDYLIKKSDGTSMDEKNLYKYMKTVEEKLNLPYHLGAYSLRKTFAYWNIELHRADSGIMACLQEMLNHDSMRTTLHYAGQSRDKYEALYDDLSSLIEG